MKVVHCKKEPYDVYIGRPSKWGNPFVIGRDGTREDCLDKYKAYLALNPIPPGDLEILPEGRHLRCGVPLSPATGYPNGVMLTK